MSGPRYDLRMHGRVIDTLYIDAMVLADEARSYFDEGGRTDREALDAMARVSFSCESLKVTTRLMQVIAWLLTQRAVDAGEMTAHEACDPSRRLGPAPVTDADAIARLPIVARALIRGSVDLYARVVRLEAGQVDETIVDSPVHGLQGRLAAAF